LKINSGYIVVKEISFDSIRTNFCLPKNHTGESRIAIVVGTNKKSVFKQKETIIHDKCIMYFKAEDIGTDCYYINEEDVNAKIVNGDIVSFRESVYVEVDKEANYTIDANGLKLEKDVEYEEFAIYNRTQHGKVISAPLIATNSYLKGDRSIPIELELGDIVYSHHFLTHKDNERIINSKRVFEIRYEDCYCRERNGVLEMLNEWNLIEPIDEDESKFKLGNFQLKDKLEKETDLGLVSIASNKLKSLGVSQGNKVLFKHKRNYPIMVKKRLYYRVNTRDIVATKN